MTAETLRKEWEEYKKQFNLKYKDKTEGVYIPLNYELWLESLVLKLMDEKECPKEKCKLYTPYATNGLWNCPTDCCRQTKDLFTPKEEGK